RSREPLGDLAWVRAQRRHGFGLFPVHRSLWTNEAGHIDAGLGLYGSASRSDRGPGARLCPRVRSRDYGTNGECMTDVVMPQMGESMVEGTLPRWLKKRGEHVERDEPLFEISTDKVDTEIPAPSAGVLSEVLVEEGTTVGINTIVARIQDGA